MTFMIIRDNWLDEVPELIEVIYIIQVAVKTPIAKCHLSDLERFGVKGVMVPSHHDD